MLIDLTKQMSKDLAALGKEKRLYVAKCTELITDIIQHPYSGKGKPEALKGDMQGFWSRRITQKHRLIYRIKGEILQLVSCYGHYNDK